MALCFSPDSSKLVLSTTQTSYILIFDLGSDKPRLLRRFEHHRLKEIVVGNRVVKSLRQQKQPNGILMNGQHASEGGEDVDMGDVEDEIHSQWSSKSDGDGDDNKNSIADVIPSVLRITISPDGQWLATSDDQRHTHVFNLDSISVRVTPYSCYGYTELTA